MSEILPGGLRTSTGYLPAFEQSGTGDGLEYRHYAELGDGPEVSMEEAVDQLRQAFDDPVLFADPRFVQFRKYVKSFYPKTRYDEGGLGTSIHLEPAMKTLGLDTDELEENPGPLREVLGRELSLHDIISFTAYLLSNTSAPDSDDPRIVWLEELRGDRESPAPTI
ncbi:MAG: hypothetical protein A3B14_02480 [Candidatus Zambryskibacteria bacterium RIFCSPLOWO2_01_FULL_45_21]|uniref:Uncharacterized protein n=1 Tax=Candidatus Zambryskibacteria bacterium RIFCSPLOWO2_01_FULL_45_21 TaxID=1802761 RepID=A0A1G2U112_9BACT|nr:MAG: hypothetical protein A3B14_02480 [Candidatus Zambryskibacteria bacterium RIFCSPLOWO2_01_FULL_45_21]